MKMLFIAPGTIHTVKLVNYFAGEKNTVYLIASHFPSSLHQNIKKIPFFSISQKLNFKKSPKIIPINLTATFTPKNQDKQIFDYITITLKMIGDFFVILINIIKIWILVKKIKPDLIHSNYIYMHAYYGMFIRFHPHITTPWGSDLLKIASTNKYHHFLTKITFRNSDYIVCDGDNIMNEIRSNYVKKKDISIVKFGVDIDFFSSKEHYGLKKIPSVISIRNLFEIYDISTIIKAIPIVQKFDPSVIFIIGGEGTEKEKLISLAKELNVDESVKFIGSIPHTNLPDILSLASIYVSTSLSDGGLAVSTTEAMACELPVIVTNTGDNAKWIKDGENGYIFPISDYQKLGEKIIEILKTPELGEKMGKNNRLIIKEHFNFYREMEKLEQIYKKVVNEQHL